MSAIKIKTAAATTTALMLSLSLSLLLCSIATVTTVSAAAADNNNKDGGFQSGPSPGSFYSGGMVYNRKTNRVFMTGSHYNTGLSAHDGSNNDLMQGEELDGESSCYVASLDFDSDSTETTWHTLTNWESYGTPGKLETCSAVASDHVEDLYVVGSVGEGGMFSEGYPMEGLLSVFDQDTLEYLTATLVKSSEDPSLKMVYPVDIIHDDSNGVIYIAAMTSTDNVENDLSVGSNKDQPNWQEQFKLGSAFDITILKLKVNDGGTPKAEWVQHFPVDLEDDGVTTPPLYFGGMVIQHDSNGIKHLLVSGSTRGTGEGYGATEENTEDEDGFVMQLNPKNGNFLGQKRHKGKSYTFNNLREGTGSDDFIRGMCNSRDQKADYFYLVGGTKGDMTTDDQGNQDLNNNAGFQFGIGVETKYRDLWVREESVMPFLRQVSFSNDLAPTWTTQWAAMPDMDTEPSKSSLPTAAYAMDCYVDGDIGAVYVVGSVLKGASMTQGDIEMINQGNDDFWVAKVDETTGNVHWLTQLGSAYNEKLAKYGSIAINQDGNVLIYGETGGNLYRQRGADESPDISDMFLMTMDGKTGAVMDNYYLGGTSSASVASEVDGGGTPAPVIDNSPKRTTAPVPVSDNDIEWDVEGDEKWEDELQIDKDGNMVPVVQTDPNNNKSTETKKKSKAGLVFGIIAAIFGAVAVFFFFYSRRIRKKTAEHQKSSIFSCLQRFDVEDVDLRRSPPGGWHGTYMNKLAYGVNHADDDDIDHVLVEGIIPSPLAPTSYEDAPLTHRSVASDALFMDDSAVPSLGGGGNGDGDGDGSGYRDNFQIDEEDEVDIRLNSKFT